MDLRLLLYIENTTVFIPFYAVCYVTESLLFINDMTADRSVTKLITWNLTEQMYTDPKHTNKGTQEIEYSSMAKSVT